MHEVKLGFNNKPLAEQEIGLCITALTAVVRSDDSRYLLGANSGLAPRIIAIMEAASVPGNSSTTLSQAQVETISTALHELDKQQAWLAAFAVEATIDERQTELLARLRSRLPSEEDRLWQELYAV